MNEKCFDEMKVLGEEFARARANAGVSKRDLLMMGVITCPAQLERLESGGDMRLSTILRILKVYGKTLVVASSELS